MNKISPVVHVVDDDAAVRQALALLISTVGLRVVTWGHPEEFLAQFDRESVGAVVLDLRMPGLSGLTVIERLRRQGADQPVIMLTGHGTVDLCRRAFKSGAVEFFEKPVGDDQLLEALNLAVRDHVLSRDRGAASRDARERFETLSPREREVLGLVVSGLTNKEVGKALGLSPRTVETHRAHLSQKLQVSTLAELIRSYSMLAQHPHHP